MRKPTLDCQTCGGILRELTQAQAAIVAERPYDFVAYCREHRSNAVEGGYA